jgi:hypothetical protein
VRVTALPDEKAARGTPLRLDGRLLSFSFEDDEAKADKATFDFDNHDLALFEREELLGGSVLDVSWGYPDRMAPARRVVVKSIKGFETLRIEGLAVSVLMDQIARTRRWEHVTRAEVVRAVAQEHGLPSEVENTTEVFDAIYQAGETDARLLRRLAGKERFAFYVDHTGLHWHAPVRGEAPAQVFTWRGEGGILSLSIESNLLLRTGGVEVRARDPSARTTTTATGTSATSKRGTLAELLEVVEPERGTTRLLARNATKSVVASASAPEVAGKEADARYAEGERSAVTLSMKVVGDPLLAAKSLVEVRGISPLLSGAYYVRSVKHELGGEGYTCDLRLTKDGVGRRAEGAAVPQDGARNRAAGERGDGSRTVEVVDKEAGGTRLEFRGGKSKDPEARR